MEEEVERGQKNDCRSGPRDPLTWQRDIDTDRERRREWPKHGNCDKSGHGG